MHLDVQGEDTPRLEGSRLLGRLAVGAVEPRRGHLGDRAVGCDVAEPHEPVGAGRVGRNAQVRPGQAQDLQVLREGVRVVDEADRRRWASGPEPRRRTT